MQKLFAKSSAHLIECALSKDVQRCFQDVTELFADVKKLFKDVDPCTKKERDSIKLSL
ncbi:hypothetical protein [Fusicatenibacter saccharivorans]|uniref:hypothetical protein n=1 Tax=Fusicatenibacter saccharivorans TaxID=1150298 RepID=UPI003CFDD00E